MRGPETEYNQIAYPSAIYSQTHPDRLATIARLFGLSPERVEKCRVLELGCGDGANLIAMASTLPKAHFVGIDLATEPIRRGKEMLNALGLQNVELQTGDIMEAALGEARFDYITAHGLYSWVPSAVRNRILEICRGHLAAQGIAFVSYNAYPGNHLRDLARGMMQYHARNFTNPLQQIRQARGLLKLVSEARSQPDLFHKVVGQEFERCVKYTDAGFYHDDLSPMNQPVYFWEFAEHAKGFGLQFVAEAELHEMQSDGLSPQVLEVLQQLDPANVVMHEQYLDFFKGRAFRHTLLCHEQVRVQRPAQAEVVGEMLASAEVCSLGVNADDSEDFKGPRGAVIGTRNAEARTALTRLGKAWPRRVPVRELLGPASATDLLAFLLRCYEMGFVNLHTWTPDFVTEISQQPTATNLARYQAKVSNTVATPRHTTLQIEGEICRKLIQLLDGTRNHAALVEKLSQDEPSFDAAALETLLRHLARAGILIA
jgi:SAM-dependent methyltransferase